MDEDGRGIKAGMVDVYGKFNQAHGTALCDMKMAQKEIIIFGLFIVFCITEHCFASSFEWTTSVDMIFKLLISSTTEV